ncbi:UNVERIFIED_ORG: peptidoglycan/LPS O-acetylase OafA/YrhL [Buttiauxella agrestis ATCC 33320]
MNLRYRSDIDGLRALAVMLVFLYHLKIEAFSGGFVGVDVFFVISGFLITGIVIRSIDDKSFSLLDFFNRRIKRIVPNVFVVSTCSVIAGWFLLMPADYAPLIGSYLYTSIYAANFYFWDVTGAYFSSSSEEMPLLHMWSLAVEEQFYFIWPILLIALAKAFKGKHLGLIAAILAVVSFALSQHIAVNDTGFAYYMLHTRSGGLLLGAALALMHRDYEWARNFNSLIAVLAGTALIIWSSLTITPASVFPGINSAIPSVGALLIIAGGSGFKHNIASKIYSLKPVVWLGLISFSVYLWHWPFIAYSNYLGILDSWKVKAAILAATIILSYISLKCIENPTRKSSLTFRQSFIRINIAFVAVALIAYYACSYTNGFDGRKISAENADVSYPGIDNGWCHVRADGRKGIEFTDELANCYIGDLSSKRLAIYVGDSNAGHYSPFVDEMGKQAGVKIKQLSTSSCWPTMDESPFGENPEVCQKFRQISKKEISSGEYEYIIVGNNWERAAPYYSYKTFDYKSLFDFYSSHAKKVILLAQMPEWKKDPATCYQRKQCGTEDTIPMIPDLPVAGEILRNEARKYKNIFIVDPSYLMKKNGKYTPFAMGSLMYHDAGHVSIRGMKWVSYRYLKDNTNPIR